MHQLTESLFLSMNSLNGISAHIYYLFLPFLIFKGVKVSPGIPPTCKNFVDSVGREHIFCILRDTESKKHLTCGIRLAVNQATSATETGTRGTFCNQLFHFLPRVCALHSLGAAVSFNDWNYLITDEHSEYKTHENNRICY